MRADVPWRDAIVTGVTPIRGGYVEPSFGPGLGVEIDFKAAENYPFQEASPIQWRHHDGAVADW
jgi:L-alanine-DL-glutamate epimerase-like enolase superfamily enzyme